LFTVLHDKKNNGYWCTATNYPGLMWYSSSFDRPVLYNNLSADEGEYLTDMVQDINGKIWSSSRFGYIFTFTPGKDKNPLRLTGQGADSAFAGKSGIEEVESINGKQIWFNGREAAFLVEFIKNKIVKFDYPAGELRKYSKNGIQFFNSRSDSKNNLWMATNIGLLKLGPDTKKISYFSGGPGNKTGLAGSKFKSIAIDKNDNLWLGYFNEGLQGLNSKTIQGIEFF